MTIEQYLSGKVDFNLNDNTIASILIDRNVVAGTNVTLVSEKDKDLCLADLYMFLATSSYSSGTDIDSDGGWQRQRTSKRVIDRGIYKQMARDLYAKWSDAKASSTNGVVVIKNLY